MRYDQQWYPRDATGAFLRSGSQLQANVQRDASYLARRERVRMGRVGRWGLWVLVLSVPLLLARCGDESRVVNVEAPRAPSVAARVAAFPSPVSETIDNPVDGEVASPLEPYSAAGTAPPATHGPPPSQSMAQAETIQKTTQLTLEPSQNGNYYVRGKINGQDVLFLVDTGASWISIPERLRWKLDLERGRYVRVSTASGVVGNYETRVDALDVGPFHFEHVTGALNPYAPNDVVLLGMTALKDIELTQGRGQLMLSQRYPMDAQSQPEPTLPGEPPLVIRRSVRECMGPSHLIDADSLRCLEGR